MEVLARDLQKGLGLYAGGGFPVFGSVRVELIEPPTHSPEQVRIY